MESFLSNRSALTQSRNGADALARGVRPQNGFQSLFSTPGKEHEAVPVAENRIPSEPESQLTVEPLEEPEIQVVNGDGGIERIIITCTCCKRIELRCQY
jgi:hypothetical protein